MPAPRIVGVIRTGVSVDLEAIDLDAGASNSNGDQFRYAEGSWHFNLSTASWLPGSYAIIVEMPDGRRYQTAVVLR